MIAPHTETTAMMPGNKASLGFSESAASAVRRPPHRCAHDDDSSHAPMLAEYEPSSGRSKPVASCMRMRQEERRDQSDADRGGQRHHTQ